MYCGVAAAVSAMLRAVLLLPGSSLGDLDSFLVLNEWTFDSIWWLLYMLRCRRSGEQPNLVGSIFDCVPT